MSLRLMILLAGVLFVSCSGANDTAEYVLFTSSRSGNSDIYLMKNDGTELQALTSDTLEEWSPTWVRPNEITYLYQKQDSIGRRVIDLETMEIRELAHPPNCLLTDKNILYAQNAKKGLYTCNGEIYLLEQGVDSVQHISENLLGQSGYPSWASEGEVIMFTNNQTGSNDIYLYDLPSATLKRLVSFPSNDERPSLSSDGKYLAFSSDMEESGNQDIMVLDMTNEKLLNVSKSEGTELIARWASNDYVLYYGSNKDGNWEIYSYDMLSQSTTRLTNDPAFDGDPQVFKN